MPAKRKPKRRRTPPARAPKKRPSKRKPSKGRPAKTPKRKPVKTPKRKPAKRKAAKRKAPKRKPAKRERYSDRGDVEVVSKEPGAWTPAANYSPFEIHKRGHAVVITRSTPYYEGIEVPSWVYDSEPEDYGHDDAGFAEARDYEAEGGEIEWYPTFDEIYDYIDALSEEYDLDAHDLFELAYGYSDEVTA